MKKQEQRLTERRSPTTELSEISEKDPQGTALTDPNAEEASDFERLSERFGAPEKNEYYAKASGRYRAAKLILTGVLVLVLITAIVLASDSVTYANLKYLLRNLEDASASDSVRAPTIPIEADGKIACDFFAGRFAVAGESAIVLHRIGGKQIYRELSSFSEPVLTVGKKYFLVWTCGENSYTVFNSVAAIRSEKTENPIYAVAAADDGSYALLTSASEYRSAVLLYDANFSLRATYRKAEGYVNSIALAPDASRIALFSFRTENGAYASALDLYRTDGTEALYSYSFADGFPLSCGFFSDGGFWCVTESALRIYGADGNLLSTGALPGGVRRIAANGSCVALLCDAGGADRRTYLLAFRADGVGCANVLLEGSCDSLVLCGDGAAVMGKELIRVSFENGGRETAERKTGAIGLAADGNFVYCIYGDRAELIFGESD